MLSKPGTLDIPGIEDIPGIGGIEGIKDGADLLVILVTLYYLSRFIYFWKKGGRPYWILYLIPICVRFNGQAYFGIIDLLDPTGSKLSRLYGPNYTYRTISTISGSYIALITDPAPLEMYENYILNTNETRFPTISFAIPVVRFTYMASQYNIDIVTGLPVMRRVRYPSALDFLDNTRIVSIIHNTIELDVTPTYFFYPSTFQD